MVSRSKAQIIIRLSPEQAKHVYRNADGWMDAGACEGGLEEDEREALDCLVEQIRKQLYGAKEATDAK